MSRQSLRRRGSWLISASGSWQMASVVGPLPAAEAGRQAFEVLTATEEVLLVSRPLGERGMRDLRLDRVLEARRSA
jgi:hypothetical protein